MYVNLRFMLIPTTKNVKTVTDMREDAIGLLDMVNREGLAYIFHHSKPRAVVLSLDDFVSMQEMLEDYIDYKDTLKLKIENRGEGVPLKRVLAKHV